MRFQGKSAFMLAVLALLSTAAAADEGMVMLTGDCPYMVLDSNQGQVLVKRINGSQPRVGDVIAGEFDSKEFATLTNDSTGEEFKAWVDVVDRHGNRALSRHGRYCR